MTPFTRSGSALLALGALAIAGCSQMSFPSSTPAPTAAGPSADIIPAGWIRNLNGAYKETEADVVCPLGFAGYSFTRIEGPTGTNPEMLGTCFYSDGLGRVGTIRVRRYVKSDDPHALAANDKLLMKTDGTAPPVLLHSGMDRKGGSRMTATVLRHGLLVDCSVWQPEHEVPRSAFPNYCTSLF